MTETPAARRRHAAGAATRELLIVTAERLYALHGISAVTSREIQVEAGQSNASVIAYHFGSKNGLIRALLEFRYARIDRRRAELFEQARVDGLESDPRTVVWVVVRPLIESIEAGEMFVPFLARLSANPRDMAEFWPRSVAGPDVLQESVSTSLAWLPDRARLGREVQFHGSVLSLLGEQARTQRRISPAQLNNYVDGWVGLLTAPSSEETTRLMAADDRRKTGATPRGA